MNCPACKAPMSNVAESEIRRTGDHRVEWFDEYGHRNLSHNTYSVGVCVNYECDRCEATWVWDSRTRKLTQLMPPTVDPYVIIEGVLEERVRR